jgi:hypothetical protein
MHPSTSATLGAWAVTNGVSVRICCFDFCGGPAGAVEGSAPAGISEVVWLRDRPRPHARPTAVVHGCRDASEENEAEHRRGADPEVAPVEAVAA